MPYSAMSHRSTGYLVPASEYNQLVDNDAACAVAAMAAKGDLFVGTGSLTGAKLAAGPNYNSLFTRSGATLGLEYMPAHYLIDSVTNIQEVVNTDVKTTVWTKAITVPLYAGSKNYLLHGRFFGSYANNSGSSKTLYLEANYGAMTALTCSYADTAYTTTHRPVFYDFWIQGNGATNVQVGNASMHVILSSYLADYTTFIAGAVDSAASVTLTMTAKWSAAHATTSFKFYWGQLAVIAPS